MSLFRENMHKYLTSRKVATMSVRTCLPSRKAGTLAAGIFVGWKNKAAP